MKQKVNTVNLDPETIFCASFIQLFRLFPLLLLINNPGFSNSLPFWPELVVKCFPPTHTFTCWRSNLQQVKF